MPDVGQHVDWSDAEFEALTAAAEQRWFNTLAEIGAESLFEPRLYAWKGWVAVSSQWRWYQTPNAAFPTRDPIPDARPAGYVHTDTLRRFIWARNNAAVARELILDLGLPALQAVSIALPAGQTVKVGPIIGASGGWRVRMRFDVMQAVELRVTAENAADFPYQALGADPPFEYV